MAGASLASWTRAVKAYDDGDLESSLDLFLAVTQNYASALYNAAVILFRLGRSDEAAQKLTDALSKDPYLAIAFYRRGYIRFHQKRFSEAIDDFESCRKLIRSKHIDYTQTGLAFKLNLSDVNFNTGLCYFVSGNQVAGMELMVRSQKEADRRSCATIDKTLDALRKSEGDFNPTLIPLSEITAPIFRPLKSAQEAPINFLGRQTVIASSETGRKPPGPDSDRVEEPRGADTCDDPFSGSETMLHIPPPPSNPPPRRLESRPEVPREDITPEDAHDLASHSPDGVLHISRQAAPEF